MATLTTYRWNGPILVALHCEKRKKRSLPPLKLLQLACQPRKPLIC